jgi:hypothetical protein
MTHAEERDIKIKLLEEMKADLWKDFDTMVATSRELEKGKLSWDLESREMFSRELSSFHIADLRLNKILYPLYHEIQREEAEANRA